MSLEIYIAIFWVFAAITIILKSPGFLKAKTGLIKFIKPVPALASAVFIVLMRPSDELFFFLLSAALVFCALGDIGMEINILPGLGFFLFSHILFTMGFLWQSILLGPDIIATVLSTSCLFVMLFYIFYYQRYLKSTTKDVLPAMLKAVNVYALMISMTLSSSLLLWLTTGEPLGFIPFMGAVLFVISDSLIGVREFHHDFENAEFIILSTYYWAIFFLSSGVQIFLQP